MDSVSTNTSISDSTFPSPLEQRSLADFSHLFKTPERTGTQKKTASPPLFSNIVIKTIHNSNIDLNVLFNILPIIKISPERIQEEDADFNEIFISVRKYPKCRGWRGPSQIKSFLDLDFYFLDRNFHMKISRNKVSIVGGGSAEISRYVIETLYYHFRTLHEKWMSFKNLDHKKRDKIYNNFINNETPEDEEDVSFYDFLVSIIDRNEEDVEERLKDITPLFGKPLYDTEPHFNELVNCNAVYNYRLPEEISLAEKSAVLFQKGYDVSYHPYLVVKCLKATWVDPETNKKFDFAIQNIGTIKQNSPYSEEESVAMYEKLVQDLGFLPYREGTEYAVKPKNKSIEICEKNDNCRKLLRHYLLIKD